MNAQVDVLAIMDGLDDRIRFECRCHGCNHCMYCEWANDVEKARDAVAALIAERETYPHERYSDEWDRAAGRLAMSYCPEIKACRDCGAPCISGHCCTFCGSVTP